MLYENERLKIIKTCKLMQQMGYFIGTWGNISLRIEEYLLLTPSRVNYDDMVPEDIVVIDMGGNKIAGERNATSEKEVHRQIYLARNDVGAIIHVHTSKAMAVSAMQIDRIPCMVEEMSQLLGGGIPLTEDYVPAQQHADLGIAVGRSIGSGNGLIIRNHGAVACGRDMDEAVLVAKVIEKSCGIYLDVAGKFEINTIPEEYVASERYRFLYTYGSEKT